VNLKSAGMSNVGSFQWIIDGQPLGPKLLPQGTAPLEVSLIWDTASGPGGVHVLCAWETDLSGKVSRYAPIVILLDQTKPSIGNTVTVGDGSRIPYPPPTIATVSPAGLPAQVQLSWANASDNVSKPWNLSYEVRQSVLPNIDSIANAEANGTIVMPYMADVTAFLVTGLAKQTQYWFNVLVRDERGNKAAYKMSSFTTL
jgi:hypothetical protein